MAFSHGALVSGRARPVKKPKVKKVELRGQNKSVAVLDEFTFPPEPSILEVKTPADISEIADVKPLDEVTPEDVITEKELEVEVEAELATKKKKSRKEKKSTEVS